MLVVVNWYDTKAGLLDLQLYPESCSHLFWTSLRSCQLIMVLHFHGEGVKLPVLAILTWLLLIITVKACKCRVATINESYFSTGTSRFVEAVPVISRPFWGGSRLYLFNVLKVYKGCFLRQFFATSRNSSAACGIRFKLRTTYVLPLPTLPKLTILKFVPLNSCQVSWGQYSNFQTMGMSTFESALEHYI